MGNLPVYSPLLLLFSFIFTFISLRYTGQPYRKPLLLTTIKVMAVSLYTGNWRKYEGAGEGA